MKHSIGLLLLSASVVLLCMAYDSSHETMATIAPTVTNASSDKSAWLIAGGVGGTVLGFCSLLFRPHGMQTRMARFKRK
jgi:hypothetical protein